MGVKGLWQLLECVGRPVTLESLENKVLGVDASLILNQSVKGMRDKHGNPVYNAHLVGLFNRVCKLLYYRIKPVFVFDGGVPHLKKKTLVARRERRFKAIHGSSRAAEKIVKNYLKGKALEVVTGRKSVTTLRSKSPREPDVFELPPLPSIATAGKRSSSEEDDIPILDQFCGQQLQQTYQDPAAINIESQDFKALPAEIQHELIKEMKEERKWRNKNDMPRQSTDFSSFQLDGVLKRGKMNQRLDELCKEMNSRNSGDLVGAASQDSLGENSDVKSQKILSEDSAHYILIKSNGRSKERDQQEGGSSENFSGEGGFFRDGQDCKIISWTNPRPKATVSTKPPIFDIPELFSSDSEILSPLVDVAEAGLSPTSPHRKRSAFSFSLDKGNRCSQQVLFNVDNSVADRGVAPEYQSQIIDNLGLMNDERRGKNPELQMCNIHNRQEGMLCGSSTKERNENDGLLTQIMSKKKELEDLIKKWEVSNKQKAAIELISSTLDRDDSGQKEKMPCHSSESKEQDRHIEETENDQTMTIVDDKMKKEKTWNAVCVVESDSEGSSVEEINASLKPACSTVKDTLGDIGIPHEHSLSDLSGLPVKVMETIEGDEAEPMLTDATIMETTEFKPVAPVVDVDTTLLSRTETEMQQDVNCSYANDKTEDVEIEVLSEQSGIGMAGDEQEAGPSGLPVEWRGATLEGLEEIQINIETEQKTLATEEARQNRIAATVSNEMFRECQELLQLFGVPYLVSPMEAEAQCAALDVLGLTEGSITDDSDIFLFGGTRVYKNVFNQEKHAELYVSDAVQRNLALNRSNLICMAFITGSDYTEGIQGVGPVGAMEILQEFSGEDLEGLKKFRTWHNEAQEETKIPQETKLKRKMRTVVLPSDFPSEEVFEAYLHPLVDESMEQFEWGKPDLHSLRLFASDKLGWSCARTDELLLPVLKQLNKDETQLKISNFFQVTFQESRRIKSKRIRQVLCRAFNPSSNSEDRNKTEGKESESNEDAPSKARKNRQGREKKRPLSTEVNSNKPREHEDDVKEPKRAKKECKKGSACRSAETRRKVSNTDCGRSRMTTGKKEKDVNSTLNLELAVKITPLEMSRQRNSFEVSQKNPAGESSRGVRSKRAVTQSSFPAEKTKTKNKQGGNFQSIVDGCESCVGQNDSTSDSTDSDSNDEKVYAGPKPVYGFCERGGRGRTKRPGRRGEHTCRTRNKKQETSMSDSSEDEHNDKTKRL